MKVVIFIFIFSCVLHAETQTERVKRFYEENLPIQIKQKTDDAIKDIGKSLDDFTTQLEQSLAALDKEFQQHLASAQQKVTQGKQLVKGPSKTTYYDVSWLVTEINSLAWQMRGLTDYYTTHQQSVDERVFEKTQQEFCDEVIAAIPLDSTQYPGIVDVHNRVGPYHEPTMETPKQLENGIVQGFVIGGAIAGATVGSCVFPVVGTVIGALVGLCISGVATLIGIGVAKLSTHIADKKAKQDYREQYEMRIQVDETTQKADIASARRYIQEHPINDGLLVRLAREKCLSSMEYTVTVAKILNKMLGKLKAFKTAHLKALTALQVLNADAQQLMQEIDDQRAQETEKMVGRAANESDARILFIKRQSHFMELFEKNIRPFEQKTVRCMFQHQGAMAIAKCIDGVVREAQEALALLKKDVFHGLAIRDKSVLRKIRFFEERLDLLSRHYPFTVPIRDIE